MKKTVLSALAVMVLGVGSAIPQTPYVDLTRFVRFEEL